METQIQSTVYRIADEYNVRAEQGAEELQKIVDELLTECLDLRYIVGINKELIACKFLIAYGGPYIWFDTESAAIVGGDGDHEAEAWLHPDLVEFVNNYMSEVWEDMQ